MSKSKFGKLSLGYEPNYLQKRKKPPKRLTLEEKLRQPIKVSQEELDKAGGTIDEDKCFIIKPVNNNNRGLLQATYWIANGNQVKARKTLRGLGLKSRVTKSFIDEELRLHRKYPEQVEHLINKPMPKEYEMKDLN